MKGTAVVGLLFLLNTVNGANRLEIEYDYKDDFIPFLGERKDHFDWVLCSTLDEKVQGNVVASPVSVKFLLVMLYESATGETARALEKALQISTSKTVHRAQTSALIQTLQEPNSLYDLEIGTRIYTDRKLSSKNWYKRILALYYNTYIEKIDFQDSSSASTKINEWVRSVTHGHIKEFVSNPEALTRSLLVLVNAVFFQGTWRNPFPIKDSFDGSFHGPSGPTRVRYMTRTGLHYISQFSELDAQLLRLPYKGHKFAMYILLPNQKDGLNKMLSKISPFHLNRLRQQLEETSVEVTIPKFHFEFAMNLNEVLTEMGLQSLFSNGEELIGITTHKKKKVVVSDIVQKASIAVTESGTVASAATEIEFVNKVGIPEISFNATHPFLFYIEDEQTGTVIFEGKFVDPEVTMDNLKEELNEVVATEKVPIADTGLPPIPKGGILRDSSDLKYTRFNPYEASGL